MEVVDAAVEGLVVRLAPVGTKAGTDVRRAYPFARVTCAGKESNNHQPRRIGSTPLVGFRRSTEIVIHSTATSQMMGNCCITMNYNLEPSVRLRRNCGRRDDKDIRSV